MDRQKTFLNQAGDIMPEQLQFEFKEKLSGTCPCCGQKIRIWKKRMISVAVASLCRLVKLYLNHQRFYHLDEFNVLAKDRNFSQLILWNLILSMPNDNTKKRTSGMYKPTIKGKDFVLNNLHIPLYVVTKNNMIIDYIGPDVNIFDALRKQFDYAKLLSDNYE